MCYDDSLRMLRSETAISWGSVSISSAAMELSQWIGHSTKSECNSLTLVLFFTFYSGCLEEWYVNNNCSFNIITINICIHFHIHTILNTNLLNPNHPSTTMKTMTTMMTARPSPPQPRARHPPQTISLQSKSTHQTPSGPLWLSIS